MADDPPPKTRHLKVRFIPPGGSTSADADAHGPKAPAPPSSAAPPPPAVEPASSGMADEPPPKTRQLKVRFIPPRGSTSGDADAHGPETLAPPSSAAPPPPAVAPASSAPRQPDPADNRSRRPRPGSAPPSSLRPPPSGKVFSPTPPSSSTSSQRKSERGVAKILDPPPSRALMSPEASTAIPTSNSRSLRRTPARAARLDAASQHCHKDEAPTKVEDIFAGSNWKGKIPLNAGAETQKKAVADKFAFTGVDANLS
ncbi:proline-rich receptor-like protein kinase PERK9 isoform X2 [Triticum dicoccoides]|uniref:proline-rich receptor-like protein kinase PERK9 isoform X2 n=1 Tax=Triticum dicoccoides TaxID=85692 RepID=UPI00189065E3|nr:proline-rich receptor-like protein kinase PERK9 isoform X2 [Triticum dicoccoides]